MSNGIVKIESPKIKIRFIKSRVFEAKGIYNIGLLAPSKKKIKEGSLLTSDSQAVSLIGKRSLGLEMVRGALENNRSSNLYIIPCPEKSGAKESECTIKFEKDDAGTVGAGTLVVYLLGQEVGRVDVEASSDGTKIVTALVDVIFKNHPYVTCTKDTSDSSNKTVKITTSVKGEFCNDLEVYFNYTDEDMAIMPENLKITNSGFSKGAANPDLEDALKECERLNIDLILNPFTDSSSLKKVGDYLNKSWDVNTTGQKRLSSFVISNDTATVEKVKTKLANINCSYMTCMGAFKDNRQSPLYRLGLTTGFISDLIDGGFAQNVTGFRWLGLDHTSSWSDEDNDQLINLGCSSWTISSGIPEWVRCISTNKNDEAWRRSKAGFVLQEFSRRLFKFIRQFKGFISVPDDDNVARSSDRKIMTVSLFKTLLAGFLLDLEGEPLLIRTQKTIEKTIVQAVGETYVIHFGTIFIPNDIVVYNFYIPFSF